MTNKNNVPAAGDIGLIVFAIFIIFLPFIIVYVVWKAAQEVRADQKREALEEKNKQP